MSQPGVIDKVSLSNLGRGAAVELFDHELSRVLENIQDPNTKAIAMREVVLKVKIKPDEDRAFAIVETQVTSKMAPVSPFATRFFIGNDGTGVTAQEHDPAQLSMFPIPGECSDNVTPITQAKVRKGE